MVIDNWFLVLDRGQRSGPESMAGRSHRTSACGVASPPAGKNVSVVIDNLKLGPKQMDSMLFGTRITIAMVIIWCTVMSPGGMELLSNDKQY